MTGARAADVLRMGRDALRALVSADVAEGTDEREIRQIATARFEAILMSGSPVLRTMAADILDAMAGACAEQPGEEVWISRKGGGRIRRKIFL